jgi:hypothetical protein
MWLMINIKERVVLFSCYAIDSRLNAVAKDMNEKDKAAFLKRERCIKVDFEGEAYISDFDLSRGLFRKDHVQDIPD